MRPGLSLSRGWGGGPRPAQTQTRAHLAPGNVRVKSLGRLFDERRVAVGLCRLVAHGALKIKVDACRGDGRGGERRLRGRVWRAVISFLGAPSIDSAWALASCCATHAVLAVALVRMASLKPPLRTTRTWEGRGEGKGRATPRIKPR